MRANPVPVSSIAEVTSVASFLGSLEDFFQAYPGLRERIERGLEAADGERLRSSIAELEEQGVLPQLDPNSELDSARLWNSFFYRVFLESIGFYPPPDANPRTEVLPATHGWSDLVARAQDLAPQFPSLDYWKYLLKRTYCERFLEPELGPGPLTGCDLACGWGRASFALRHYEDRTLHCCDHSEHNLELLKRLAANAGLSKVVNPHRCEIFELPFEDDQLDFTIALDIFELLPDEVFERVLLELLRCHRVGAPLYCKVTLHAFRPSLGQVQDFTHRGVIQRFTQARHQGKKLKLVRSSARVPEHFTFRVEPAQSKRNWSRGRTRS